MFLEICELVLLALVCLFFVEQIFYPLWRGTALWPMFGKEPTLLDALAEEKQKTVEEEIKKQIKKEGK